MKQKTYRISLFDALQTKNAMIHTQGIHFRDRLLPSARKGQPIEISLKGMRSLTSGFLNNSIGRLVLAFPEMRGRITFVDFPTDGQREIWQENIDFALGKDPADGKAAAARKPGPHHPPEVVQPILTILFNPVPKNTEVRPAKIKQTVFNNPFYGRINPARPD